MKLAVILAAGQGTRLRSEVRDMPKGFVRLGMRPIVEESIQRLLDVGIERVVIVTGFLGEFYDELAEQYPERVITIGNERYAESGSMYSLCCAAPMVNGPFLLLESDLIYEPRALTTLVKHPSADAILLSGSTGAGDEVFVETNQGRLVNMSKDRAKLGMEVSGELVGISKVSPDLFAMMIDWATPRFKESLRLDYETDGLVAASRHREISCPVVDDLLWAEIDNPRHLQRARQRVYPLLPELSVSG